MQVIKAKNIKSENGKLYNWVFMAVDNPNELTTQKGKNIFFVQGSIAWDVNSGKIYGLNGNAEWQEQSNITLAL